MKAATHIRKKLIKTFRCSKTSSNVTFASNRYVLQIFFCLPLLTYSFGFSQVELNHAKAIGGTKQEKLEADLNKSMQQQLQKIKSAKTVTKKMEVLLRTKKMIGEFKQNGLHKKFKNVFQAAADFETFFSPLYTLKIEKVKKAKKAIVSEQKCREKKQELYLLFDPQLSESEQRPAATMANAFLIELCKLVPQK